MSKKYLIIIVTLILLLTITSTSASTNEDNKTAQIMKKEIPQDTSSQNIKTETQTHKREDIKTVTPGETLTDKKEETSDNDCTTSIIHVSENESAISYRRDSTFSATIHIKNENNIIKQYKTTGSYFVHTMISSDGWLIGSGGNDNVAVVNGVEKESNKIIKNNKLTTSNLNTIINLKRRLNIAHFVIKSPTGEYALFEKYNSREYRTQGKLKNGEYIVVPNSPAYFHKGNYIQYTKTKDVTKASQLLCAKDRYGVNRRNIITYHYKTNNINSTITVTATNDNGKHSGRSTAGLRDNIQTSEKYIKSTNLPVLDKHIHVKTFNFKLRKAHTTINMNDMNLTDASMNIKATITDELQNKINSGKVSFTINGKNVLDNKGNIAYITVNDGEAILKHYDPMVLKYRYNNITAKYTGTDNYMTSQTNAKLVNNAATITMNVEKQSTLLETIHINANITYADKSLVKQGTAIIKINNKALTKANGEIIRFNIKQGKIKYNYKLPIKFPQGNITLTIEYTNNKQVTVTSQKIIISKISPKINYVTLKANRKLLKIRAKLVDAQNNKLRVNTNIQLKINNQILRPDDSEKYFTINNGILSLNYNLNNQFSKGKYTLTAIVYDEKYTTKITQHQTLTIQ